MLFLGAFVWVGCSGGGSGTSLSPETALSSQQAKCSVLTQADVTKSETESNTESEAERYSMEGECLTRHYVSNNGDDGYSGTSEENPWKTMERVNSTNFSPGDCILFKRGDVWRETLTVSSSGEKERPIIYGSYGKVDQPNPIIIKTVKCGNWWRHSLIYNGGFEWYVDEFRDENIVYNIASLDLHGDWDIIYADNDGQTSYVQIENGGSYDSSSNILLGKGTKDYATWISQLVNVKPSTMYYIEYYGWASDDVSLDVQIKDESAGNKNVSLQDDGTWQTFDTPDKQYLEVLKIEGPVWTLKSAAFRTSPTTSQIGLRFFNGNPFHGGTVAVDGVYMVEGGSKDSKKIWGGTESGVVCPGGAVDLKKNRLIPGRYYYSSEEPSSDFISCGIKEGSFYYRDDSGEPELEVGGRDGIVIEEKKHVVIDGIDVVGPGQSDGKEGSVWIGSSSENITVKNLEISCSNSFAAHSWIGTREIDFENLDVHDGISGGIYSKSWGGSIRNSKIHGNGNIGAGFGDLCGLCVWGGDEDISGNEIYNNSGGADAEAEVSIWCPTAPILVKDNYIHDCGHQCAYVLCGGGTKEILEHLEEALHYGDYYYQDMFDTAKDPWPEIEFSDNIFSGFGLSVKMPEGRTSRYGHPNAVSIGNVDNIKIVNNTITGGILNFDYEGECDGLENGGIYIRHNPAAEARPVTVRNNVFDDNECPDIVVASGSIAYLDFDLNTYSKDSVKNWVWKSNRCTDLECWRKLTGLDTQSSVCSR